MELEDVVGKRITHIVHLDAVAPRDDDTCCYLFLLDDGVTCEVTLNAILAAGEAITVAPQ